MSSLQKLARNRADAIQSGRHIDLSSEADMEPALAGLARDEEEERTKQLTAALAPILERQVSEDLPGHVKPHDMTHTWHRVWLQVIARA